MWVFTYAAASQRTETDQNTNIYSHNKNNMGSKLLYYSQELFVCMHHTKARPVAISACLQSLKPPLQATKNKDTFTGPLSLQLFLIHKNTHLPAAPHIYIPPVFFTFVSSVISSHTSPTPSFSASYSLLPLILINTAGFLAQ